MNPPLTLLSPARDLSVAKAAIQAGADAVYIGAPRFGAREAAGNSLEDIAALVRYAHPFGVQVLVTLNTLLEPEELPEAFDIARQLYHIGIDALIVQDLVLAEVLFRELPALRLHASTQCDNRTPEHVAHLRDLGFKRVVLARELTLDEIQAIHEAVPDIELEAFVHGALCVSYSGRCYMSEALLGRSANRGCCAQMCRMRYDLLNADKQEILDDSGEPIHQRYLLSLQDLDRSQYLAELIDAGVTTFKIEGRLKDAAYVTNITAYYRQKIDQIFNLQSSIINVGFSPNPTKTFHRGATDYFLHGRTRPMANFQTPKSTGEPIGEIVRVRDARRLVVRLHEGIALHNGDGLCIGDLGFSVNGITQLSDGTTEIFTNTPLTVSADAQPKVSRNYDIVFLKSLSAERRVPVDVLFEATPRGFRLTYTPLDGRLKPLSAEFEATFEPASNPERAAQTIREQLTKLGDTIYEAHTFEFRAPSTMPFIPISQLNAYRRDTLAMCQYAAPERQTTHLSPADFRYTTTKTAGPLMTCRYCLLFELGHCRKTNPLRDEPKYLRLQNGTTVRLHFDCRRCEMQILPLE